MIGIHTDVDIDAALDEFDDLLTNLLNSDHSNSSQHLARFIRFLSENEVASAVVESLPRVDFDGWYEEAKKTVKSMVGSGTLEWPNNTKEEIAIRLALMRHISVGHDNIVDFCFKFMYAGNRFDDSVQKFNEQIVAPFAKDFVRLLKRIQVKQVSLATSEKPYLADMNKIFVVHGHDDAAKEAVARFLEKLKLKPIILHEQPNKGFTLIEKLEHHSIAGFAIVLLTPDDMGAKSGETHQPRARQNVIFELGYFIGKLGRDRVAALYKEGVEKPSDYDGVLYITLDQGRNWQIQLARELKEAGLSVDMNTLIAC